MELLILQLDASTLPWCTRPRPNPAYRGTYRPHPYYVDALPATHEVNQAFLWYLDEGGELGIAHDLVRSEALVRAYREIDPPQQFEIVEAVRPGDPSRQGGLFLGFDLSDGLNNSLLWYGQEFSENRLGKHKARSLLRSAEQRFKPMLNHHGLFDHAEPAAACLTCLMDIQRQRLVRFECGPDSDYEVVGLYRI